MNRSPLIIAATRNVKLERIQNYLIAAFCGVMLGVMLALGV